MEKSLKARHQACVLLLTLLVHAGIITTLLIMQIQHTDIESLITIESGTRDLDNNITIDTALSEPPSQEHEDTLQTHANPFVAMQTVGSGQEQEIDTKPDIVPYASYGPPPLDEQKPVTPDRHAEKRLEEILDYATTMVNHIPDEQTTHKDTPPHTAITYTSSAASSTTAAPLTLAQLAQGFVQSMQQVSSTQHADMAVVSNQRGIASLEQIKHVNYCKKIIECIVNSYKIKCPSGQAEKLPHPALVYLALNKTGGIHTLQLYQSSGSASIDRFLLDIFQHASSSFPPLPSGMGREPYPLPVFTIEILESLRSSNGWCINAHS